jgi:glutamate-1-semialdehyde 2,1-aminomutase
VERRGLPWHVIRVVRVAEFICAPGPLRDGTQAEAAHAPALEQAIHRRC